jgi:hypothetical protein
VRRMILAGLVLLMAAPCALAGRQKKTGGEIQDGYYVDATYGFRLKMHDNWKPRFFKEDSKVRLALTQKDYGIPTSFMSVPDYTKIPRITVYVDTTSMNINMFVDSLLSPTFKSDQKNAMIKEFEFLQKTEIIDGDIIPRTRSRVDIDGESGLLWKGQTKYLQLVQTSASSMGGNRVRDAYGGALLLVKRGGQIYIMHLMCEWQYIEQVMAEAQQIMLSLNWDDPAAGADTTQAGEGQSK